MQQNYLLIGLAVVAIIIVAAVLMQGYKPSYPMTTTTTARVTTTTAQATTTTQGQQTTTTQASTASVNIANFAFSPATLTITAGTTVTWTNMDSTAHTVTSDSGSELSSGQMSSGQSYSHKFTTPGTYSYHCANHPSMTATIVVQ